MFMPRALDHRSMILICSDIWFEFGVHPGTDLVDIADSQGDVVTAVPKIVGQKLIEARQRFLDEICKIVMNDETMNDD